MDDAESKADAGELPAVVDPRRRDSNGKGPHRFKKGESGNPKGRPRGDRNRRTLDAREFCSSLTNDPAYRESLRKRLIQGTAGAVETLIWHYSHGKPVERTETGGPGAFADVTTPALRLRLADALKKLG